MNSKNLIIRKLNNIEIISVYNRHLKKDFPREERRPLLIVLKGIRKGYYDCYGCFEEGQLVGYMFLVKSNRDCLVDYFAVVSSRRNQGIGSAFLRQVSQTFDVNGLILEVEDPAFAEGEEEKKLRERRVSFYKRNGFVDTDISAVTFGVEFILLRDSAHVYESSKVRELYETFYRCSLGDKLYEHNISIR